MQNTLLHGCCLELMQQLEAKSIDLILTDLPYGTTAAAWDIVINPKQLWQQYKRILKPGGVVVLTASQPFTAMLVMSNPKWFKYEWIWVKDQGRNFQLAKKQPLKITESVLVFAAGSHTYNPQDLVKLAVPIVKSNKKKAFKGFAGFSKRAYYVQEFTNYPKNILNFKCERGLHQNQKPVPMLEYLIKTYTNPGETVLDSTCGSASTLVAAHNTGRNFIGMEKGEAEYLTAKHRLQSLGILPVEA